MLRGNLAPDGALIKVAGLGRHLFQGPARVFDSEEACMAAVAARQYQEGEALIIRYEGPKGWPGHARDAGGDGADLWTRHG